MLERVKLHGEHARRRLEQQRQINVIGAEAHTVLAQARTRRLIEALHVLGDLLALEHAEPFGKLERNATRDAGDVLGGGKLEQRPEELLDMSPEPEIEPRLHGITRGAGELL